MPPSTPDKDFVAQCLKDTGYLCRNLLGWNYDMRKDPASGKQVKANIGTGGVRDNGPHRMMTDFLDDPATHHKVMLAPRESYKSTILQGFVTRQILKDPNVRILYGMRTDDQVFKKARAIKRSLESEEIVSLFGDQKSDFWQDLEFTVAGRTKVNLQEPTFSTFSLKSPPTGGHFDYIIFDDPVDDRDYINNDSAEKAESMIQMCDPLLTTAGYLILVGTRYHDQDVYGVRSNNEEWSFFSLDSGVTIERTDKGFELAGQPRFGHHDKEYLYGKLRRMGYNKFLSQYMNVVPQGLHQPFRREDFQAIRWDEDMRGLSGYILTDTAVSEDDKACYSVIAYIGFDARNVAYVLDLRVGRWPPVEFVQTLFEVYQTWQQRCNHIGEVFEEIGLNTVFMAPIHEEARRRKVRLNIIKLKRGIKNRKVERIQRLEARFNDRTVYIVDTVPKLFRDIGGNRVLWDPKGYIDPATGASLPGGELVEQFVRFPVHQYRDIPDALADMDAFDGNTGARLLFYRKAPRIDYEGVQERRVRTSRQNLWNDSGGDWWDKVIGNI